MGAAFIICRTVLRIGGTRLTTRVRVCRRASAEKGQGIKEANLQKRQRMSRAVSTIHEERGSKSSRTGTAHAFCRPRCTINWGSSQANSNLVFFQPFLVWLRKRWLVLLPLASGWLKSIEANVRILFSALMHLYIRLYDPRIACSRECVKDKTRRRNEDLIEILHVVVR